MKSEKKNQNQKQKEEEEAHNNALEAISQKMSQKK